uniref:Uncharacterized protein n=1 Tax=Anguilla anguilla TaxID=7936 RepID=A0A0E9X1X2_ANGAN
MEIENKRKLKERCALRRNIAKEFLAEFLGTFVLIVSTRARILIQIKVFCDYHSTTLLVFVSVEVTLLHVSKIILKGLIYSKTNIFIKQ